MMLTEDEAETKWCPMTIGGPGRLARCCGSECMAWRWSGSPPPANRIDTAWTGLPGSSVRDTRHAETGLTVPRKCEAI
jgi:hypothetical protein